MATETTPRATSAGAPTGARSALRLVVIISLLLVALSAAGGQIASGAVIPPEMGYLIGGLVAAGLMFIRWRWMPVVVVVLAALGVIGGLSSGFPQYALSHPAVERVAFLTIATQYGLLILVAGVCAIMVVQALRGQPAPRWTTPAIACMAGVIVGALFIGAIAQPAGAGGAANVAGTETVHLVGATFAPNIIALHKGDTLTVVDDSPTPHILANGTWSASGQAQGGAETGAPAINNVQLNNNTVVLGPFMTSGTYHIYCTVHPGMNLTVIVE
jgi:plastocyanin